jgi:flagellar basal-body rod protein FlgG
MFDALYIAATGMNAQQQNVDAVANNLANVNTVGFKKSRVSFFDLVARDASQTAAAGVDGPLGPLDETQRVGVGVGITSISKVFDAGDIKKTDSPWDVAISGDGFLELVLPDGARAYTRGGTLKVNADGLLATSSGQALKPNIAIPDNAQSLVIAPDGKVTVQVPNQAAPIELGQLEVVRFANPAGLTAEGDNVYRSSAASGEPIMGRPGDEGLGSVRQGSLEGSNVKMVEEMVNLMVAQRAYEASVKVIQASDEMLGMVNSLRR